MARWFRRSMEWGGNFTTAWGFLPATWQTAATGIMSGLTAYFGWGEVGKAQAIFYASGVLAFGMSVVFLSLRISQIIGMFQRLSVAAVGIANISLGKNNEEINHINMFFVLRNESQRLMFYRLKRVAPSLARVGPTHPDIDRSVLIIAPNGGVQQVNIGTMESIKIIKGKPPPEGTIELEVEYGDTKENLQYLCRYTASIHVAIVKVPPNKEYHAALTSGVKSLEHTKV